MTMKAIIFSLTLVLHTVSSFAPQVQPSVSLAPLSDTASPSFHEDKAEPLRKRDQLKKVVQKVKGKVKDVKGKVFSADSDDEDATVDDETTATNPSPTTGRKKKLNGKKYEKIDNLEDKAFAILLDLGMIEEHN